MSSGVAEPDILDDVPEGYELVHGKLIECPPMSYFAGMVANNLKDELILNESSRKIGRSYVELHFHVPTPADPRKIRRPDLAFVTFETLPADKQVSMVGNAMPIVPNLVVEVVSPTDTNRDVLVKKQQYLQAGVQCVWVIYPETFEIYCYEKANRTPRVFGPGDTLTGDPVLPGFELAVDKLFPPVIPESIPEPPDDV